MARIPSSRSQKAAATPSAEPKAALTTVATPKADLKLKPAAQRHPLPASDAKPVVPAPADRVGLKSETTANAKVLDPKAKDAPVVAPPQSAKPKAARTTVDKPQAKPKLKPAAPPRPRSAADTKPDRPAQADGAGSRLRAAPKPKAKDAPVAAGLRADAVAPIAPADKAPAARPTPSKTPSAEKATLASPLEALDSNQRRVLEALSLNLAKASLTAQGAITDAMLKRAESAGPPSADPFHVAPALTEVMGKLALKPERIMRAQADLFERYMDLWAQSARRAAGEPSVPVATVAKGDKRFNDPDWTANPMFDMMKQSYLLTSNWLNDLVSEVEDVEPVTKRRVEFFTKMLTDAFSPSNFLVSNPAALREALQSQGQSLLKGAQNFAADLARGGGQLAISQTDYDKFKVGENVATAPGKVIYRGELFELLQFSPSTETVFEIPLLIFPPWINKYYILDLRPENSMIRWLASQGFTVFVTSWVNPDATLAGKTLEDYMFDGVYRAVETVLKQTGSKTVNTVGYCIGGTLLSCALAHMAAKDDHRVESATFFAAQQDFAEAGDLLLFTDDAWLKDLESRIDAAGGVSPSGAMADTFNSLRANDLIWSFFVNNYLMGKEPAAFDLLFWNADQTRMPKALHLSYLTDFYKGNRLAKGELVLDGVRLDLKAVTTPIYVQSSKEDHIAPIASVYRGSRLFGGPVRFMMAGSGHIAGVINHPDAKKYQYWTNQASPPTIEDWTADAVETAGSWWPDWRIWLAERSGKQVPARDPAGGPLAPIEDAPGTYVKVRSGA